MPTPWNNYAPPKKDGKVRIAIGVPYKDKWEPEFAERLLYPLKYQLDWCEKAIVYSKIPSLPVARDSVVKRAIEADADYLLFVDSDMVLENPNDPNIALKQLYEIINKSKDKDNPEYKKARIISGLYRAKQPVGFNYAMWIMQENPKGYAPVGGWKGNWLVMDVIGLGFCLIDMMVFKEVPGPWFNWNEKDDISEDFYFCELVKKNGFDIRVFTDIKLSHLGTLKVKSDGSIVVPEL